MSCRTDVRAECEVRTRRHLRRTRPQLAGVAVTALYRLSVTRMIGVLLAGALVSGGCSVLAPKQDRTRFIMLAPLTVGSNGTQSTGGQKLGSVAIGLGPVQLPEYLDRPELVIRTSPNGFELSETARWAEPLIDNFRHVLASDLTNLLGTNNITQYPWYPGTRLDYIVHVQVQRFEADSSQRAEFVARWQVRTAQSDQVLAARESHLSRAMTSPACDAAAAALSANVAELAGEIASVIVQAEQQRLASGPGRGGSTISILPGLWK